MADEARLRGEKRAAKRRAEEARMSKLHEHLWPPLRDLGWKMFPGRTEGSAYVLPAARFVHYSDHYDPLPAIYFHLIISKKSTRLRFEGLIGFGGAYAHVDEHADHLKQIGAEIEAGGYLLKCTTGWGSEKPEWGKCLPTVRAITEYLMPTLGPVARAAEQHVAVMNQGRGPMEINVDVRL